MSEDGTLSSTLWPVFRPSPRLLLALLALVLSLSACNVSVDVVVDVESDGSGVVSVDVALDAEAAARIPELATQLRTDDLVEAGWLVTGPEPADVDGGVRLRAEKPFSTAEQLDVVLAEITGPSGAFRDFELLRERSFGETTFTLTGTIDFTEGLDLFTDAALVESLDGDPFGIDLDSLEAEVGPLAEAVDVTVAARLPGSDDSGAEAVWQPRLDDAAPIQVNLTATDDDLIVKLLRWVAIAAFVLFVASVGLNLLGYAIERAQRKRAPAVRTPAPVSSRVPVAAAAPGGRGPVAPAPAARAAPGRSKRLALVVLDIPGVVYGMDEGPASVLGSFLRERGEAADDAALEEISRQVTLGRMSTAEMWDELGVAGSAEELDEEVVAGIELAGGAQDFVREMRRRGLRVASVGNEVLEWSRLLRARDALDGIDPWVVSAEVGVRKPDPGIYEALRRSSGVPYEDCLMIDARLTNLDAAKTLGMSTVWFAPAHSRTEPAPDHPVVSSFAEFFRRRS